MGLGATIIPTALVLVSCTSSQPESPHSSQETNSTIPLASIQATADQIDNPTDAIAFLNQTLAQYYTFNMFKEDIVHAYHHYHKDIEEPDEHDSPGTNQIMLSAEYTTGIDFVEANADHRTINLNTYSYSIGTMVGGSVNYRQFYNFYNIPIIPVLVNVKGTVYMGLASPFNGDSISSLEPEGNVAKSFVTQIGDNENHVCDDIVWPLIGTRTCWMEYQSKNFPYKVIWNYKEVPYFDPIYNYWFAHYQNESIIWFVSKYFPIKFPGINVPTQHPSDN